ncbi:DUF3105 domain-containing protein [Lipingzhangella rawalii]|uniref:DUF3105 domain-containing protein n=1 Tax=Lipingzhangella rawalii TaxID=2055835 RepID=UPI00287BB90C|nr:DUF3105 domain-containing protein [Lipingzhangella rawalii]
MVVALLILLGGGGAVAFFLLRDDPEPAPGPDVGLGNDPLADVREYTDIDRQHYSGTIDYPEVLPPPGGPHNALWLDCGVYTSEVPTEFAVHSLEHGAVWITYEPSVGSAEVEELTSHYTPGDYLIVSPFTEHDNGLAGEPNQPIALTAWGAQLGLDEADAGTIDAFLSEYQEHPSVPEPGGPCSSGVTPDMVPDLDGSSEQAPAPELVGR